MFRGGFGCVRCESATALPRSGLLALASCFALYRRLHGLPGAEACLFLANLSPALDVFAEPTQASMGSAALSNSLATPPESDRPHHSAAVCVARLLSGAAISRKLPVALTFAASSSISTTPKAWVLPKKRWNASQHCTGLKSVFVAIQLTGADQSDKIKRHRSSTVLKHDFIRSSHRARANQRWPVRSAMA